jgi:hypothetical protein
VTMTALARSARSQIATGQAPTRHVAKLAAPDPIPLFAALASSDPDHKPEPARVDRSAAAPRPMACRRRLRLGMADRGAQSCGAACEHEAVPFLWLDRLAARGAAAGACRSQPIADELIGRQHQVQRVV